jgi:hypothetical protein
LLLVVANVSSTNRQIYRVEVTTDELAGAAVKEAIRALDSSIDSKIGDHLTVPTIDLGNGDNVGDKY